jgi:hypothetical protein
MHTYRFRILLEENEQFFREIDVKANQTFEEFHDILVESAGFQSQEIASFYICDSKWNKLQEICLCDMAIPEEETDDDDDGDEPREKKKRLPIVSMSETKLSQVINDPHQRIIYVYDFLRMHTFYIELFKILPAENGKKYPAVIRSAGKIAVTAASAAMVDDLEDEEDALLVDFNDMLDASGISSEDELMEGFYDDAAIN